MDEATDKLNVAGFSSDSRRGRYGEFGNLLAGYWGRLRLKLRNSAVAGWVICFSDLFLWFSLPLSIWLSTGWVGLIFHWQAFSPGAWPTEVVSGTGCRSSNGRSLR